MNACSRCGGAILTAGPIHYAGLVCGCGQLATAATPPVAVDEAGRPFGPRAFCRSRAERVVELLDRAERAEAKLAQVNAWAGVLWDEGFDEDDINTLYAILSDPAPPIAVVDTETVLLFASTGKSKAVVTLDLPEGTPVRVIVLPGEKGGAL